MVGSLDEPRVLDVGCGSGRVAEGVLEAGAGTYIGIDFSAPMIGLSERRLARFGDKVTLMTGDFMKEDLSGPFDVVLALGLFDYIDEPVPMLTRMREFCAPGGTVLGSFPGWTWVKGPLRKVRYEWVNDCPIFNYKPGELEDLHRAAGFDRVEVDEFVRGGYLVRAGVS